MPVKFKDHKTVLIFLVLFHSLYIFFLHFCFYEKQTVRKKAKNRPNKRRKMGARHAQQRPWLSPLNISQILALVY